MKPYFFTAVDFEHGYSFCVVCEHSRGEFVELLREVRDAAEFLKSSLNMSSYSVLRLLLVSARSDGSYFGRVCRYFRFIVR